MAKWLAAQTYVDGERIGIWGWSFGGFNTLMSMSEGTPVFRAGVAVAAPSNWKYYDTIYTERYMRTPKENAEGYAINPSTAHRNSTATSCSSTARQTTTCTSGTSPRSAKPTCKT